MSFNFRKDENLHEKLFEKFLIIGVHKSDIYSQNKNLETLNLPPKIMFDFPNQKEER